VDEIEILQDVVVFEVVTSGKDVHVDVYGSASNVCGSIRFTFVDPAERRAKVRMLRGWRDAQTPLTYVSTGSTIALQNDAATFGTHLDPIG